MFQSAVKVGGIFYICEPHSVPCDTCGTAMVTCGECHCDCNYAVIYKVGVSHKDYFFGTEPDLWRPAIMMPKYFARTFVKVLDIRVERGIRNNSDSWAWVYDVELLNIEDEKVPFSVQDRAKWKEKYGVKWK